MLCPYYRSLDRDVSIFGLKGRWITVFLYGTGAFILLGVVAGNIFTSGVGIAIAIGGLFVSFFVCLMLQTTRPAKLIDKWRLSPKMDGKVVRREQLSRIVLSDPGYRYYKSRMRGGTGND